MVAALALATWTPVSRGDETSSTGDAHWMGVEVKPLTERLREEWDYRGAGVMVTAVNPESPAGLAGVVRGDVLVVVGSTSLRSPSDLEGAQTKVAPGEDVSVVMARNMGRMIHIVKIHYDEVPTPGSASVQGAPQPDATPETATPNQDPPAQAASPAAAAASAPTMPALGVQCETLEEDLATALEVEVDHGVFVLSVTKEGPADLAGIRAGDVISKVGDKAVGTTAELEKALAASSGLTWVRIHRHGNEKEVEVRLAEAPATRDDAAAQDASAREIQELKETVKELQLEVRKLQTQLESMRADH
jgi:S1-C subfamily serine protease